MSADTWEATLVVEEWQSADFPGSTFKSTVATSVNVTGGTGGSVVPSDDPPTAIGTSSDAGTADEYSRGDHSHDGSAFQAASATLTSLAGLSTTSYGRSFLELADPAAGRTALGLGTAATAATADFESAGTATAAVAAHVSATDPHGDRAASVLKTLYDAHTILAATADNSPAAITVAEQTILGRASGGDIAALTAAEARAVLSAGVGGALPSVAVNDYVQTSQVADSIQTAWGSSIPGSVNMARFTQFYVARTIKTSALRLECTTAATTGAMRMGIYSDENGRPGTVLAQGTVAWAAAMLEVTFTEVTLTPGVYYVFACAQHTGASSTNPIYRGSQRGQPASGDTGPVAGTSCWPFLQATISGSAANNPSCSIARSTASTAPMIWLKVTALP